MGIYVPVIRWECEPEEPEEPEEETLLLRDAQLVLATIDEDTLVVDFLVPSTSLHDQALRVPFTLRARVLDRRHLRVPSQLRDWLASGAPVDVSLRRRGSVPVARITESHDHLTLEVRSVAPPIGSDPGRRRDD